MTSVELVQRLRPEKIIDLAQKLFERGEVDREFLANAIRNIERIK